MNASSNTRQDRTYNGWSNYETWAVGMYLDGNYSGEGTYRAALEVVAETIRERNAAGDEGAQPFYESYVADALKTFVEETIDFAQEQLGASIASDLLRAAFDEVNWWELAESKLAEVQES